MGGKIDNLGIILQPYINAVAGLSYLQPKAFSNMVVNLTTIRSVRHCMGCNTDNRRANFTTLSSEGIPRNMLFFPKHFIQLVPLMCKFMLNNTVWGKNIELHRFLALK